MSDLPNSVIRLVPPTLRGGYCPDSWTEFARTIVGGTNATPSAGGLADKATLIGMGVAVNTN